MSEAWNYITTEWWVVLTCFVICAASLIGSVVKMREQARTGEALWQLLKTIFYAGGAFGWLVLILSKLQE